MRVGLLYLPWHCTYLGYCSYRIPWVTVPWVTVVFHSRPKLGYCNYRNLSLWCSGYMTKYSRQTFPPKTLICATPLIDALLSGTNTCRLFTPLYQYTNWRLQKHKLYLPNMEINMEMTTVNLIRQKGYPNSKPVWPIKSTVFRATGVHNWEN